ncbi:hypothetical protein NP233_g9035 [Leucocoprinus birnbaumii]|uniref:Uncharacterized protein n=1 Tax=Leucocoprinus birnbaumii TaxID=56174 RepID=A0AAD5VL69_9AGAR|nr:hypothetical protein NP233_g9035 [Leucocoprinus birnbaumii]
MSAPTGITNNALQADLPPSTKRDRRYGELHARHQTLLAGRSRDILHSDPEKIASSYELRRSRHNCIYCYWRQPSPTETFYTCPPFPESAVNSFRVNSNRRSFSKRDVCGRFSYIVLIDSAKLIDPLEKSIQLWSAPSSPSPPSRTYISHEILSSPLLSSIEASPVLPRSNISVGAVTGSGSIAVLTPRRSLRRSTQVIISTPPSPALSAPRSRSNSPAPVSPQLASPISERRLNNRRWSDVNPQTYSGLFELELSPILEDVHVVDQQYSPAVSKDDSRVDATLEYVSEGSDSSFGSLLEIQTFGSAQATVLGFAGSSTEQELSIYEPSVPALTVTSPTPETLQSVIFSDAESSGVLENEEYPVSALSPNRSRDSSIIPQAHGTSAQSDDCKYLAVPSKNGRLSTHDRRRAGQPKTCRERSQIWTRAWKRASHLFIFPRAAFTLGKRSSSKPTRRARMKVIENQNSGTSAPLGDAAIDGYALGPGELQTSSSFQSTIVDVGSRRRISFGIPTLARRRLAKRHDSSKRYTVAF